MVRPLNNREQNYIPPVILQNYEEFKRFACKASVVTYNPQYLRSPFLDDKKRITRVTLAAVGVPVRDMPLNFVITLDYGEIIQLVGIDASDTYLSEDMLPALLEDLGSEIISVRGGIETGPAMGELLTVRS